MNLFTRDQRCLAIDFGSSNLKLVEVITKESGVKLNRFIVKKLRSQEKRDNNFLTGDMAETLAPIFKGLGSYDTTKLILSGENLIIKFLTVPQVDNSQLEKLIFWEAQNLFSIPLTDLVIDYQILSRGEKKIKLLLAAVEKSLLIKQIKWLEKLGCKVSQVTVAPLNLEHILSKQLNQDNLAIIDIGAKSTKLSILSKKQLVFRRVLQVGSADFTYEIQQKKNLSYRKAEELKKSSQLKFDLIKNSVTKLLKKISLSIHYWKQQNNNLDKLLLTGGGAKLKELDQVMTNKLDLKVELLTGLSQFEFGVEDFSFHLLKQKLPYLSLSLAAALTNYKEYRRIEHD